MEMKFKYNQVDLTTDVGFENGPSGVECVVSCLFKKDPVLKHPCVFVEARSSMGVTVAFTLLTKKLDAATQDNTLVYQGDSIVPGPSIEGEVKL